MIDEANCMKVLNAMIDNRYYSAQSTPLSTLNKEEISFLVSENYLEKKDREIRGGQGNMILKIIPQYRKV